MKRLAMAIVVLMLSLPVPAGDEVDYDAPYLTVVDGELVTRYPAKSHANVGEDHPAAAGVSRPAVLAMLVAAGLLAALFLPALFRRGAASAGGRPPAPR